MEACVKSLFRSFDRKNMDIRVCICIYMYVHRRTRHVFSGEFIHEKENEPSQKSNHGNLIKNIGRRTTIVSPG